MPAYSPQATYNISSGVCTGGDTYVYFHPLLTNVLVPKTLDSPRYNTSCKGQGNARMCINVSVHNNHSII